MEERRKEISIILSQIGIPKNLIGYKYLITAIDFYSLYYYEDIQINDVYQVLLAKHKIRKQRAREALRYAINYIDLNSCDLQDKKIKNVIPALAFRVRTKDKEEIWCMENGWKILN